MVMLGHSVLPQADEEEATPFLYLNFALCSFLHHVHPICIVQAIPLHCCLRYRTPILIG